MMKIGHGKTVRVALCQMKVTNNKDENLKKACDMVKQAAQNNADLVCLPECFTGLYDTKEFSKHCETIPGKISQTMADCAKQNNIHLVCGTMIESENGKMYNTCMLMDPKGNMVAKHRELHMCDMDVPGCSMKESEVLTQGNKITVCDTPMGKIGLMVCYDMRFPLMAEIMAKKGCDIICCPGMCDMITGPAHWPLLQCCRALDCQCFMVCCAPARDMTCKNTSYAHSSVCNPWGEMMGQLRTEEDILFCDMDMDMLQNIREQIPVRKQCRTDLFDVVEKSH